MLRFIDLFCGIGGFRLALEKRGLCCVFSSEIDPHAQSAYEANFREKPSGDIMQIPASDIPSHDVLCGGFPCPSFSIAGKRLGLGDPRGQLFREIVRIADYHKPSLLLLENVKNILSIDDGNVLSEIEETLDSIGYNVHYHLLNASHFGIPQARERVYFVCTRKDIDATVYEPAPSYDRVFLQDVLEKEVDDSLIMRHEGINIKLSEAEIPHQLETIRVGVIGNGGQGERIYSPKGHAVTQSAHGGGWGAKTGLYHTPQGVRKLTLLEAKRVMGFPDTHIISKGNQGYQQLGNAVVPAMIGHVYDSVQVL